MTAETEQPNQSTLATTARIPGELQASARDRVAAQAVASGLHNAKASNTRRAYASAWHSFQEWAQAGGHPVFPSTPQAVALYLGHQVATGKSMATTEQARASISHAHAAAGISSADNPARHPVVAEAVKGWRNQAPAPKQAAALTADALAQVREVIRLPRLGRGGRMESVETARKRAALDLAILGVLADGGLRRSEAAALAWSDVEWWDDGTARITIQKGKNQPEPETVAVTAATARALRESRSDDADLADPVFGLTGEALANRVRAVNSGRRLGRRVHRTQRPHRDGAANGGSGGAQRGGAATRAVEARRHGGPLHSG